MIERSRDQQMNIRAAEKGRLQAEERAFVAQWKAGGPHPLLERCKSTPG